MRWDLRGPKISVFVRVAASLVVKSLVLLYVLMNRVQRILFKASLE